MKSSIKFVVALAAMLSAGVASAAAVDDLRAFLKGMQSGRATFTQQIISKARKPHQSVGSFAFARPGKFRWLVEKPYYQLLVADGDKLWVHDRDLNQVSVKKIGKALGASPAALLFGDDALDKNFELVDDGKREGLDWVLARPRGDNAFEWVRLGLSGGALSAVELKDNFGQVTRISIVNFERNAKLDAALFRFTPPAGADVVGD